MEQTKKFIGSFKEVATQMVDIASKYRVEVSDISESNSEVSVWVGNILFDATISYDPKTEWRLPNVSVLDMGEKIPFYVLYDLNSKNEEEHKPHIQINSCGSTIDFWKDEEEKLRNFYKT